jgi:GNAT superfamily N-acetyltransferase
MIVTFRPEHPLEQTMVFEDQYEPELRLSLDEKRDLLHDAIATFMFVDGALAGETYGVSIPDSGEEIEGYDMRDAGIVYCYSTTVLPAFQGRGLSRVLCAYWLGLVKQAGFRLVLGHATSPAMIAVKRFFGARLITSHEGWYGTARVAHFYELPL